MTYDRSIEERMIWQAAHARIVCAPDNMPIRRLPIGRARIAIRIFPNSKGHTLYCEGHEHLAATVFLGDPTVTRIASQPHRVEVGGFTYLPDFLIEDIEGATEVIEFKGRNDRRRNSNDYLLKIEAVQEVYHLAGYRFRLIDQADVNPTAHDLATNMLRNRGVYLDGCLVDRMLSEVADGNVCRFSELVGLADSPTVGKVTVLELTRLGRLWFDASIPLDRDPDICQCAAGLGLHKWI